MSSNRPLGRMLVSKAKNRTVEVDIDKVSLGSFYTTKSGWLTDQVRQFLEKALAESNGYLLDPFAGDGHLLEAIKSDSVLGAQVKQATGFDIQGDAFPFNDSLVAIPNPKRAVIVTNPPYLANHSAKRKGVDQLVAKYFAGSTQKNLYRIALEKALESANYVVAIIPETFLLSTFPKHRLELAVVIQDSLYTFANIDVASGNAAPSTHYRPSTNNATYSVCTVLKDANASRIAAVGVHFSATTAANTVPLDGEEIALYLYKWEDNFVDLNDAAFGFNTLTQVAGGYYYFPSDLQGELVYGAFDQAVVLEDGVRYLACAQTVNLDLYLGFDGDRDHTWNYNWYAQPMSPIESDGAYFAAGFGADVPNGLVLRVIDANNIGLNEANTIGGMAYPNPTTDKVTVSIEGEGLANLTVTDISGKQVLTQSLDLVNGKSAVSIETLDAGVYIFNLVLENGKTSQFNVVKR